jgi:WD repeat-containing protein 35
MWRHALGNYQMSGDAHAIAEAHIMLENYDELEDLINGLPDNDEILPTLADKFRLMGLCQSATTAYLKVIICTIMLLVYVNCIVW